MIVGYIDAHKDRFGVEPICRTLQDAPNSYYAAKTRPASARSVSDADTTQVIKRVDQENFGVYGVRKVHAELGRQGHRVARCTVARCTVARCTVARLMRAAGLPWHHQGQGPGMRYDNLKPAVVRVLKGRDRAESERFTALRSHYGSTRFSAGRARTARTRRAASRARSAGSAAVTLSRSRRPRLWRR